MTATTSFDNLLPDDEQSTARRRLQPRLTMSNYNLVGREGGGEWGGREEVWGGEGGGVVRESEEGGGRVRRGAMG